jgi:predicted dehydrogenase
VLPSPFEPDSLGFIPMRTVTNRRRFLSGSAKAGAGLLILANSKLAFSYQANSKLNIAGIGVGGQGRGNLDAFHRLGNNLVALCDVDSKRAGDIYQKHPGAKRYDDFRKMFDEMDKQIDAVLVATPDHTHAVAAVTAMKLRKHVYCEKPLTRTVYEARVMRETAARQKVVTQMGNQGSAENRLRRAVELIWGGVIGDVREAHVWFDGGNGPMKRPPETAVPEGLNWDLWLGPAEYRPYSPAYVPGTWRSWRAFGSGIIGDFACHTANIMFRALHLEQLWQKTANPGADKVVLRIQAWPSERDLEGYPSSVKVTMDLPARGALPPVKATWYAKEKPSEDLLLGFPRAGWGDLLVGSKGSLGPRGRSTRKTLGTWAMCSCRKNDLKVLGLARLSHYRACRVIKGNGSRRVKETAKPFQVLISAVPSQNWPNWLTWPLL